MPYQHYEDGLYLLKKPAEKMGVDHYGIVDIGNCAGHPLSNGQHPLVIHQTPPSIKIDWLQNTGSWTVLGRITDQQQAIARMKLAFKNPNYDLFGNNCEHFARYVATGRRESTQLQAAGLVAGLVALYFLSDD